MKPPEAIPVDLGIQVADGEKLKITFAGDALSGSFQDWREAETRFRCQGVISFRWHPIEYFHRDERPDSTYEILNSDWIRQHESQGMIGSAQIARHFKLNFNAIGCLEVICSDIAKMPNQTPDPTAPSGRGSA